MSNILLSFPSEQMKEVSFNNSKIIFLDYSGFWIYSENKRKRVKYQSAKTYEDLDEIRDELNWWNPIWNRWLGKAILYEEIRNRSTLFINEILGSLKELKIKGVIQSTSVAHHIDNSLMSIACKRANIREYTLYANVFDGRFIPLVQRGDIFSRKIYFYKQTKVDYELKIDQFLNNKKLGLLPRTATPITAKKKSFLQALVYIFKTELKKIIFVIKNRSRKNEMPFEIEEDQFTFIDKFQLIYRQKKFLEKYKNYALDKFASEKLIYDDTKRLILASHFQPEATSFPEGANFSNNLEIVLKLRSLGYEKKIFYKEHIASEIYLDPPSIGLTKVSLYKNIFYLESLKSLNCVFLDMTSQLSLEVEKACKYIPITMGGTITIERALAGFKTIVFGQPYFKDMPGIVHIDEINSKQDLENLDFEFDQSISENSRKYILNILNDNTISIPNQFVNGRLIIEDSDDGEKSYHERLSELKEFIEHILSKS